MINWKEHYIETEPAERSQYFWVSIFYYMAKTAIDDFGLEASGASARLCGSSATSAPSASASGPMPWACRPTSSP